MAAIEKLSQEIIGKIAAGEVVERPASVVKELVENAIDAGATNVTVELRGGGVEYIRISDNGRGIPAGQIRLAFERHATSKLRTAEQLFDVHTLGFRGEALASVAAVAKVTCTTKTQDADFGVRCLVEGGEFKDVRQAASPVGTTLVVEDLFFNTPVRRKFLKKPALEAAATSEYMLRLILSHPEISFRYVSQGKTVYHSIGDGKLESALFSLYGKEAFSQMLPVRGNQAGVLVKGYVGTGELSRGNRQQQSFFVNGRFFKSTLLSRAVENGCEGRVMIGKFPMCALFLELPYGAVDVNVHPNKLEVRFQDENSVADAVQALVGDAMRGESLGEKLRDEPREKPAPATESAFQVVRLASAPEEAEAKPAPVSVPERATESAPALKPVVLPPVERAQTPVLRESPTPAYLRAPMLEALRPAPVSAPVPPAPPAPKPAPEQTSVAPPAPALPRLVGVVFDTYWIFEAGDRLLLVDQHAAHERILYDQLMKRMETGRVSQRLLSPQLVAVGPRDMALANELHDVLYDAGFEIEPFDDKNIAVHAVPVFFGGSASPKELFLEALDEWQAGRGQVTPERMRRQVAQMACKHAIKGGDRLNENEMNGFLREMLQSASMPTCPHGRPIVTEVSRAALEKRFKRI